MTETAEWGMDEASPALVTRGQAKPWPRFWAKMVDINIWGWPLGYLAGLLFPTLVSTSVFEGSSGATLFGVMMLPFCLAVDALVVAAFGNTPGRALAGIRVETLRHERLDVMSALNRSARIYVHGMAIGFPLVSLFAYYGNFSKVRSGEQTSWDVALNTRVYDVGSSTLRTVLVATLALGLNVADRVITAMQEQSARSSLDQSTSDDGTALPDPIAVELKEGAAEVKPQMLDDVTRLERADAEGRTLTYHYTIVRRDASDEQFYEFFQTKIKPGVCANADMARAMRDYQITYRYSYMMPNAEHPLVREISWADCK